MAFFCWPPALEDAAVGPHTVNAVVGSQSHSREARCVSAKGLVWGRWPPTPEPRAEQQPEILTSSRRHADRLFSNHPVPFDGLCAGKRGVKERDQRTARVALRYRSREMNRVYSWATHGREAPCAASANHCGIGNFPSPSSECGAHRPIQHKNPHSQSNEPSFPGQNSPIVRSVGCYGMGGR